VFPFRLNAEGEEITRQKSTSGSAGSTRRPATQPDLGIGHHRVLPHEALSESRGYVSFALLQIRLTIFVSTQPVVWPRCEFMLARAEEKQQVKK